LSHAPHPGPAALAIHYTAAMRTQLARLLLAIAMPLGLLLATHALQGRLGQLPAAGAALLPALPYLLLLPGLLLALLFSRGRAFFLLLLLGGFYWALTEPLAWQVHGARLDADALRLGLAFLLPLLIALFAGLRERGVFTRHGLLRLGLVALPVGVVAILALSRPHLLRGLLEAAPFGALTALGRPPSQPVWLALALAGGVLLLHGAVTRAPFALYLLGVLAAVALVLRHAGDPLTAALYATTATLLILIAIVHDSHRMAYRDELTGLPGRRALQQELLKLGSRYAIAMLDVDHFKRFNDRHGHAVGDQVLKLVAARMHQVRGGGRAFRYGGEEFTVLFPGRSSAQVVPYLERLRETIAASAFQLRAKDRPRTRGDAPARPKGKRARSVSVTVSIGVAERDADHSTPGDVIKKADRALYLAKGGGRNRVCS